MQNSFINPLSIPTFLLIFDFYYCNMVDKPISHELSLVKSNLDNPLIKKC